MFSDKQVTKQVAIGIFRDSLIPLLEKKSILKRRKKKKTEELRKSIQRSPQWELRVFPFSSFIFSRLDF